MALQFDWEDGSDPDSYPRGSGDYFATLDSSSAIPSLALSAMWQGTDLLRFLQNVSSLRFLWFGLRT